ncbi:hypothetical protein WN66_06311 [Saccharomyces cerevisiae]|uniref:Putative uncharacterized protein YPL222C-A n=2 Tax=Saccharomyces cerevisiae TaxID=4932 RepID=YP22A_YEAST|nr:RecName: Full=Putative uncharacterized protein YPL222C-A [Saccharomyces cerevisiae S288C]AAL79296.1 unknown [Saccharomyces cerevisiae]KZV07290.1 hypothetical protein WN66_06311 [Saccharomyces cerevisiae]CAY86739.1 EC1118_1P2_0595p [Saccharomyces cerevisiae EC1118]
MGLRSLGIASSTQMYLAPNWDLVGHPFDCTLNRRLLPPVPNFWGQTTGWLSWQATLLQQFPWVGPRSNSLGSNCVFLAIFR